MQFDMPLEELRRYRPSVEEPDDFDEFWAERRWTQPAADPLDVEVRRADSVVSAIDVFDVRFTGHGGAASPPGCSCRRTSRLTLRSSSSSSATAAAGAGRRSG